MKALKPYFLTLEELRDQETNSEGETTYYIRGRIMGADGGSEWEDCLFITDNKMEDW